MNMRTMRSADILTGAFLVLIGAAMILAAGQIEGIGEERLHPAVLPRLLGWLTLAAGAGLAWSGLRAATGGRSLDWPDRTGWQRLVLTLVSLVGYLALIEPLGLPIATALYTGVSVWYLGRYRWWAVVLGGLLSGIAMYWIFIRLLDINFPVGPIDWLF
jgi:hypothetical protein